MKCTICSISSLAANTYAYMGEFHSNKTRAKQLSYAGVFIAVALTICPGLQIKNHSTYFIGRLKPFRTRLATHVTQ